MFEHIQQLLFSRRLDQDELFAMRWKIPTTLQIEIKESDGTYFAKVTSFGDDNVVTQANTGQELVEMINDALYAYLDIPVQYKESIGFFMPPEPVRQELQYKIPAKYLNTKVALAKA